jgi:hypothetical protein
MRKRRTLSPDDVCMCGHTRDSHYYDDWGANGCIVQYCGCDCCEDLGRDCDGFRMRRNYTPQRLISKRLLSNKWHRHKAASDYE